MMRAYVAYSWFELKLFFKDFIAIFFTLIVPAFICAVILSRMEGEAEAVGVFQQYMPEISATLACIVAMFVLSGNIVLQREMGFYKRIMASPVTTDLILGSMITRGLAVISIAMLEMLLICWLFTQELPSFAVFQFLIATVFSCSALFMIGFFVASLVEKPSTMFIIANIVTQILVFATPFGLQFIDAPQQIMWISKLNPLTHVVNLMSLGWDGSLISTEALLSISLLGLVLIIGITLIRRYFSWVK